MTAATRLWALTLEYYLSGAGDGTGWRDNREIVMLAGIKADLLRFEPGAEDRS
jgi:hypothetical protein